MQSPQQGNPTRANPADNCRLIQVGESANENDSDQEEAKNSQRRFQRVEAFELLEELRVDQFFVCVQCGVAVLLAISSKNKRLMINGTGRSNFLVVEATE